jgi:hypothetical protein
VSDAVHYQRVREHLELLRLDAALVELDGGVTPSAWTPDRLGRVLSRRSPDAEGTAAVSA